MAAAEIAADGHRLTGVEGRHRQLQPDDIEQLRLPRLIEPNRFSHHREAAVTREDVVRR